MPDFYVEYVVVQRRILQLKAQDAVTVREQVMEHGHNTDFIDGFQVLDEDKPVIIIRVLDENEDGPFFAVKSDGSMASVFEDSPGWLVQTAESLTLLAREGGDT